MRLYVAYVVQGVDSREATFGNAMVNAPAPDDEGDFDYIKALVAEKIDRPVDEITLLMLQGLED